MIADLFYGIGAHLQAFRYLATDRELRRLAAIPFLINLVLFLVAVPLVAWLVISWIGALGEGSGGVALVGWTILQIVAGVAVVAGSVLLFGIIGGIIAGPFSGPLSERVEFLERERLGLPGSDVASRGVATDIWRGLLFAFGRLFLFLLVYPLIFLLQFIPGVGHVLFGVLAFIYSAFVLSVDYSDPYLDRRLESFRAKLRFVLDHKGLSLGFGSGAVLLLIIPFVNLVMIPVCVVAGTVVWVGEEGRDAARGVAE